jgi:hypothetical protein
MKYLPVPAIVIRRDVYQFSVWDGRVDYATVAISFEAPSCDDDDDDDDVE